MGKGLKDRRFSLRLLFSLCCIIFLSGDESFKQSSVYFYKSRMFDLEKSWGLRICTSTRKVDIEFIYKGTATGMPTWKGHLYFTYRATDVCKPRQNSHFYYYLKSRWNVNEYTIVTVGFRTWQNTTKGMRTVQRFVPISYYIHRQ